jgi:hypothetical protein
MMKAADARESDDLGGVRRLGFEESTCRGIANRRVDPIAVVPRPGDPFGYSYARACAARHGVYGAMSAPVDVGRDVSQQPGAVAPAMVLRQEACFCRLPE